MSSPSSPAPDGHRPPCRCPAPSQGLLFLIVGPSGAGKDTLIDGARAALTACPTFVFPRRVITRAPDADGEVHEAVSPGRFRGMAERHAFFLTWSAHGLDYGIPARVTDDLAQGRHVVINVSRRVVAEARARAATRTILVTAAPEILARRLSARGREDAADIAARLARTAPASPDLGEVTVVHNEGAIADGVDAFLAALGRHAPDCAALTGPTGHIRS